MRDEILKQWKYLCNICKFIINPYLIVVHYGGDEYYNYVDFFYCFANFEK